MPDGRRCSAGPRRAARRQCPSQLSRHRREPDQRFRVRRPIRLAEAMKPGGICPAGGACCFAALLPAAALPLAKNLLNHCPETALVRAHAGMEAEMDPATSAVMVLLWCSPDMLFCRRPPAEAPETVLFDSFALRGRAEGPARDVRRPPAGLTVGRCQPIGSAAAAINWGISPSRELLTSLEPEKPPAAALPVDAGMTGSTPSAVQRQIRNTRRSA